MKSLKSKLIDVAMRQAWWMPVPGLALAAGGAMVALLVANLSGTIPPSSVAVALGIAFGNVITIPEGAHPGVRVASKHVLRVGVVLLGFRLVLDDVIALGPAALALVTCVAGGTLAGTILLGRLMQVGRKMSMLIGTGFAICGASAVAAAQGTVEAEEEDVAAALGLVLLFGTLSIGILPLAAVMLDLPSGVAGAWIGAAIHDVGQAVAAAELVGGDALEVAILIKLGRVLLLGPVIVVLTLMMRVHKGATEGGGAVRVLPWFVLGFVVAVGLRSLDVVPTGTLSSIALAERASFGVALFALGTEVRWRRLRALGWRPIAVGAIVWLALALVGLIGGMFVIGDAPRI